MARSQNNNKQTFSLPRKGKSAIRITAPESKLHHLTRSPPEDLIRAFSQDSHLERWPKPGATTCGIVVPAPFVLDGTRDPSMEATEKMNSKRSSAFRNNGKPSVVPVNEQPGAMRQSSIIRPKGTVLPPTHGHGQRSTQSHRTSIDAKSSSLDLYAINYIPQYLKAINECPAQIRCSLGLPVLNYAQYIAGFAGFSFLKPPDPFVCPSLDHAPLAKVIQVKDLDRNNYELYLNSHMFHELQAQNLELQEYTLHNVSFDIADQAQSLYSFVIPGIRENSPQVDLGDIVLVRPWSCVPHEGLAKLANEWCATNGANSGRLAPGFSGWEYRAVVWGLQRSKERVILRLDGFPVGALRICNVAFIVQEHKCTAPYSAIARVTRLLQQDVSSTQWLRCMLFPAENHGVLQKTLSKGSFDVPWYDRQLNFEQQKAADAIIKREYGTIPFIISGPPGTGKTKTLVEIALQLLHSAAAAKESCHLLICAPSDPVADTIAIRLQAHLNRLELFRLNGWTRSFAEVPEPLMLNSYTENGFFSIPNFTIVMNFKVIVTTCRDAEMFVQARLTNIDLAVLTTQSSLIASSTSGQSLRLHWSALLLDEAAQATEADALIPLTVVQPGVRPREGFHSLPQFILAGDEHQLGPKLSLRRRSGIREYTLFQRLFERELYTIHPLSRRKGSKPLTAAMLPLIRPPFVNLVRNYRSHPAILTVPSVLFYHDTLMPEVTKKPSAVASWRGWSGPLRWPVLFVQKESPDSVESILAGNSTGAGAVLNVGEAVLVQKLVMSLLSPSDARFSALLPHEIMVISPFRVQVNYLRLAFRSDGLASVNIGPLEAFQGLESRVVVLCTTRTRLDDRDPGRFVRDDQAKDIGLIGDANKFNVALTRAREGLIVIGDAKCLTCTGDEAWAAFIAFCERNGCVERVGENRTSVSSDVPPGRMEKALRYAAGTKAKEKKTQTAPTGFGYATNTNGVLRGYLPTSDEAMWADGIRLAEENEMNEADEEDSGEGEEYPSRAEGVEVVAETPASIALRTVAVNGSGQLISVSPETNRKAAESKERVPAAEETVFDRDLETEVKKEGCEME